MKTPLSYYGGKQQLAATILKLLPEHKMYVEPFMGGGAIFFAKEPSPAETINDTNGELINFYEVIKRDFPALQSEIEISLHSRKQHHQAEVVYANPDMFDRIKRAWAVWMLANTSYGCKLNGNFGYDRKGKLGMKVTNKREAFTEEYAIRLQNTTIECCDALRIIKSRDTPDTFFYCDPPYVGADQGHYDGYTQDDFDRLLETLAGIQGKFLLSSYRNTALNEHIEKHGWECAEFKMRLSMSNRYSTKKQKTEVMTANYAILDKLKAE
ncbi:MAG: DNA adenine methylase [Treponemataceae bacterium]|nr:MAG: DNA adenine methylase [Treponemataceae bacterium]